MEMELKILLNIQHGNITMVKTRYFSFNIIYNYKYSISLFHVCFIIYKIIILFLYIIQVYYKYFKVLYPLYNFILNISIYNYLDMKFKNFRINETLENRTTIFRIFIIFQRICI